MKNNRKTRIGVIIVSFSSNDVIVECLESLANSTHKDLHVVVCDNASADNSNALIRDFASANDIAISETSPVEMDGMSDVKPGWLTLIKATENLGYAGAVNLGLDYLMKAKGVDAFWILNPDSVVQTGTADAYVHGIRNNPEFGLMSGRTLYFGEDGMIQSDGGRVNMWTGICSNVNFSKSESDAVMPKPEDLDYLSGANLIASRNYVQKVGKMKEDYFLYFEEVDWAMRRGDFPLVLCEEAVVLHHGGTAIGSGTARRRHTPFANYFNFRNRAWFVWRFRPWAYPVAYVYSALKVLKLFSIGAKDEAISAWRGLNNLRPPKEVSDRIDPAAHKHAFGRKV